MSGDRINDQGSRPEDDLLGDSDLDLEMVNGGREASRPLMTSGMNPTMGWSRPASNPWYDNILV